MTQSGHQRERWSEVRLLDECLAHLGFVVDDVDSVIERLEAKGFEIDVGGAEHPFRKTVYFVDLAGLKEYPDRSMKMFQRCLFGLSL